ncbi:MAG: hypothetical protein LBL06_04530 [Treponema sp.]|nr:hypothetical protein [Treponema sp.]
MRARRGCQAQGGVRARGLGAVSSGWCQTCSVSGVVSGWVSGCGVRAGIRAVAALQAVSDTALLTHR